MSQANLQAFALEKGITKALDKMSQGEMVMLRYQYLMQATADAQGDFARTSDGFANSQRLLSANLEAIQTKLGQAFIPILANATTAVNDFLTGLVQERPRTVLDDFADINLKTEEKLKEIEKTAEQAEILISTLAKISAPDTNLTDFISGLSGSIGGLDSALQKAKEGNVTGALSDLATALSKELGGSPEQWQTLLGAVAEKLPAAKDATLDDNGQTAAFMAAAAAAADDLGGDYSTLWGNLLSAIGDNAGAVVTALANAGTPGQTLAAIADGANKLSNSAPGTWSAVLGSLASINGLENIFGKDAGAGVKSMAEALSGNAPDETKAEAWKTLITTLSENAEALSSLTGKDAEGTKAWLESIQGAASKLKPDDAKAWQDLFGTFLGGLGNGEKSGEFLQGMAQEFLAMGTESEIARQGLLALYGSTDEVESKQAEWLETCKRLVQTIPGLSSVIDVNTGRVNGGTVAVEEYVKQWQDAQTAMIMMDAIAQKQSALVTEYSYLPKLKVNMDQAKQAVEQARKELEDQGVQFNEFDMAIANGKNNALVAEYTDLMDKAIEAEDEYNRHKVDYDKAKDGLQQEADAVYQVYGNMVDLAGAAKEAGEAVSSSFSQEQLDKAVAAIESVQKTSKVLAEYTDKVFINTMHKIQSTLGGFGKVVNPVDEARKKVVSLNKQLANFKGDASEKNKLSILLQDAKNSIPTLQNMNAALDSQLKFLNEYFDNVAKMRKLGYSDAVIAMVSDGSTQSAAYAKALADKTANSDAVKEINAKVEEINTKTKQLSGTLTENTLKVDEEAKKLTTEWIEAVNNLDQYVTAEENTSKTMNGIVDGLTKNKAKVQAEVDSIIAILSTLSNANYRIPGVNMNPTDILNQGKGPLNISIVNTVDGRGITTLVSQNQADQLNQINRSGGVL